MIYKDHLELTNHRHQVVDRLDPLRSGEQVHDQIAQVAAVVPSHLRKIMKKEKDNYSNVGRLFCTPAPPKFTKKLAVDSFFNFGS